MKRGIRLRTLNNEVVPVFCGSAFKNKGVQALLDAVIEYMPAPVDVAAIKGVLEDGEAEAVRTASDEEPFAALAFKIATDPFVGTLAFFRVYSGSHNVSPVETSLRPTAAAISPARTSFSSSRLLACI